MGGGGEPSSVSGLPMGDSLASSWESVKDSSVSVTPPEEQLTAGSTSVVPEVNPEPAPHTAVMKFYPHLNPENQQERDGLSQGIRKDKGEREGGASQKVVRQDSVPLTTEEKAAIERGVATTAGVAENNSVIPALEESAASKQEASISTGKDVAKDDPFRPNLAFEAGRMTREEIAENISFFKEGISRLLSPEGKAPISGYAAAISERAPASEEGRRKEEAALHEELHRLSKMQGERGKTKLAHTGTENQGREAQKGAWKQAKQALEKSKARLAKKAADITALREDVMNYVPGDKLLPLAAGRTEKDYDIPERTVLLLVGDMGAGKSTLVNNIHRAVHNTKTDLDIAATANCSTGSHSMLLQEYAITPGVILFDTRGVSIMSTGENVELLKKWIKQGVADSQAVIRSSDGQDSREAIQDRVRPHQRSFCKRRVNFAIYVVNAATVHDVRQRSHDERLAEAERMRKIFQALHHFKDNSPIVVMTHGDQLSPEDRDGARMYIGQTLGVDPGDSVYDIASFTGREQEDEEVDPVVDATILCMLQQALKLADRSMPPVTVNYYELGSIALFLLLVLVVLMYVTWKWLTNMI